MFNAYAYLAESPAKGIIDMRQFNQLVIRFRKSYLAENRYHERITKHRKPNELRQEFIFQLDKELREICLRPEMHTQVNKCAGYIPVKIKELWIEDKTLRTCYDAIAAYCETNALDINVIAVHIAEYKALNRVFRNIQRENHKSQSAIKNVNLHTQNPIQMYNYTGIIIGIEHYNDSKKINDVKFALNDANGFLNSLTDLGCDPDRFSLLTDHLATKTTIKEEIKRRADLTTKDDVLIFYFAGHGLLHDGKNVLTSVDTSLNNIGKTTVDLNFVLSTFERCASKKIIAFLDCCHSGITFPDTERSATTTFSTEQLQYDYRNAEHLVVFASCKNDEKSQGDIERSHGAWSYYLIEALRGNGGDIYDGGLLFSDKLQRFLMENTYQRVKKITLDKKNQTPVKFGTETIDKFIVADVAFINIGGLAIGMTVAMLIGLWLYDEFSFNKYFAGYDRIGMIMTKWELSNGGARSAEPMPLGVALSSSYAQDFKSVVLSTQTEYHVIAAGDKKFTQQGKFMQTAAPDLFSFHMLAGDRSGLEDMNSMMISSSLAQKLFGNADPIGRQVKIDNQRSVNVTGVFEDFPKNTDFDGLTFFAPLDLYMRLNTYLQPAQHDWGNNWVRVYAELAPGVSFETINAKIAGIKRGHVGQEEAAAKPTVFLHPMAKWHLHSAFGQGGAEIESGEMQAVWFYGIIGVFVLFLACINFMNLSTARSEKRAREVGIRKVIGSMRRQLIGQFFSESILITAFAFGAAILLALLVLPWFNDMSGKQLHILWENPWFWLSGIAFIAFTGLIAGSYPALYLSSFRPVSVLKGSFRAGRRAALPRKVLVVLQFTVSIALMIGTVVVYRQIGFAKDRPVGYQRGSLLTVPVADPSFKNFDLLENELKNTGAVVQVGESASPLTNIGSGNSGLVWKGKDPSFRDQFGTIGITPGYGKAIGWTLTSGRDFSRDQSDSAGFVINEAAVKYMGLRNPVGQFMQWPRFKGKNFRILGVVKDMVMNSPFEPAVPSIFFLSPDEPKNFIFIKLNPHSSAAGALSKIAAVFNSLMPAVPFAYQFADDDFAAKFGAEERIGKFTGFFGTLAILISCLGLFGLASYVAEQRKKELGVRKILGATVFRLWGMLSKDFLILVMISFLIASPLTFLVMHTWLQKYAYHTPLSWWIFAGVGLCATLITLMTISFQSLKAAVANPVGSLRSE